MKKLAFVFLLLAALGARADVVIVEKLQNAANGGQDNENITIKIKGGKARVDMGVAPADANANSLSLSTIVDLATGDRIMLVHNDKSFMKIPAEGTKKMLEQMKKDRGDDTGAGGEPKVVDTGEREKVGDYDAEIYTVETPKLKITVWISKEVPDYAALQVQLSKVRLLEVMQSMGELPDISKIEGVPVKTEITVKGKTAVFTTTLVSVKETQVDDAEFRIPAEYREGPLGIAPE